MDAIELTIYVILGMILFVFAVMAWNIRHGRQIQRGLNQISRVREGRQTSRRIVEGRSQIAEEGQRQQHGMAIETGLRLHHYQQQDDQDVLDSFTLFSKALEKKEQHTILVPSQIFVGNLAQENGDLSRQDSDLAQHGNGLSQQHDKEVEEGIQPPNLAPFDWGLRSSRSERRSIHLPSPFNWALVNSCRSERCSIPSDQLEDESKVADDGNDVGVSVILKNDEAAA